MKDFEWTMRTENETENTAPQKEHYEVKGTDHGISYAPAAEQKTKGKKKSLKPIAALCAACVILSGAFGFGGAALASRMNTESAAESAPVTAEAVKSTALSVKQVSSTAAVVDVPTSTSGEDLTYAQAAALVKDSVVEINTEYTTRNAWYPYTTGGAGSGVILSEDGYIVTNAHVILDENMQNPADAVTVRLTNGEEYEAKVIAYDTDEDIAVLKIEAEGLTAAHIGDSDSLAVGEEILVVGNPLGELGGSVSNGIVSATEREIQVGSVMMTLVQTNAAVNPGNSGGGMFNLKGELVGIVNAKSSGTGIEGIGFAIPVNQAVSVAEQLLENGYVSGKPMIGVSLEDVSDSGTNGSWGMYFSSGSTGGTQVIVRGLSEGMNDDVLKVGDRIVAVNGEEVTSYTDVKAAVSASAVGDKLTFTIQRDGKLMEVEVTVYERTEEAMNALSEKTAAEEEQPSAGQKPEEDAGEWQIPDNWNDLFDMFGGSGESAGQPEQPQNGENPSSGFDFDFGQIPESLADLFGGR